MNAEPNLTLVAEPAPGLAALPDADLMVLVRAGRSDAFEALVLRHQGLVLGLATRFLGCPAAGRDAAQEAFLCLWADRERYREQGRFRAYLVSVAIHCCQAAARSGRRRAARERRYQREERLAESAPPLPCDALVEAERRREVRAQLLELPAAARMVLILRYTHDLPINEIARLTGMPPGTVKSHLSRGARRLCRLLRGSP